MNTKKYRNVSATHHSDVLRRQLHAQVQFGDGFITSHFLILPGRCRSVCHPAPVRPDLGTEYSPPAHHAADHRRNWNRRFLIQFSIEQRIGSAKINGIRGDFVSRRRKSLSTVIDFVTGFFLVGIRPFGIHRRGSVAPAPVRLAAARRRTRSSIRCAATAVATVVRITHNVSCTVSVKSLFELLR